MGYAAHSPAMEPVLAPLRAELAGITPRAPEVPMISTVTGGEVGADGEVLGPDYWVANVRQQSRLLPALRTAAAHGIDAVIELSPHPVLLRSVRATLPVRCLPSLQRGTDDGWSLLSSLGELFVAGHPVDDGSFPFGARGRHTAPSRRVIRAGGEAAAEDRPSLVPVTAHTAHALIDTCRELANHVERDPGLAVSDLAYTLATRRSHLAHRAALVVRDREELLDGLAHVTAGEPDPRVVRGEVTGGGNRRVAFVFSGGGTHWPGMGRGLLAWHAGFRESMVDCDAAAREVVGWSVLDELAAPPERSRLDETDVQQPVLFALQVALARLWLDLGVTPVAVLGHSIGEVAAACVAGALSIEDGVRVAAARSHLIQHKAPRGAFIAVELPADDLRPYLVGYEGHASVAAVNSPTSCAVSGAPEAIAALDADLRRAGIATRSVRIDRPGHSALMDPLLPPLREALRDVEPRPFALPFHSTALDGAVNPVVDADYWAHNLRDQVRFAPTVAALVTDGVDTFVEISPHGALRGAVEETALAHGATVHVVDCLRRGEPDADRLLGAVASLFTRGVPLSTAPLHPADARVVETPLPRWQKERHWLPTTPTPTPTVRRGGTATPVVEPAAEPVGETEDRGPEEVLLDAIAEELGVPVDKLGRQTQLQDLGLDSMLAMRLANRVRTAFGHRVSPVTFLDGRPVGELVGELVTLVAGTPGTEGGAPQREPASVLAELSEEDAEALLEELDARGLVDPPGDGTALEGLRAVLAGPRSFELAPSGHGQTAIWFMQQLSPDGVAYNLMFAARIPAELDEPALRRAVRAVVERHPALRTVFVEAGGRPYQLVLDEPVHEFVTLDGSDLDDDAVLDTLVAHGHRPLDLDYGPILRIVVVSRAPDDHHLLLVIHHVAADAASADVVVHDLRELYALARRGELGRQEPVAPYTDFVEWERRWLDGPDAAAALRWWSERLAAPPPHLDLARPDGSGEPAARSAEVSYEGEDLTFRWRAEEAGELKAFAARAGVSVSTLVMAGFFAALNRVYGVEDVVLATAVAQRGEVGRESAVGYYLNTVLVRARPTGRRTFRELLDEVHEFSLGMLAHMDYPLDLLASALNPPRVDGRPPWFDIAINWLSGEAFTYANTLFHGVGTPTRATGELPLVPVPLTRRIAKFDLEITMGNVMGDVSDEVVGQVQYKPSFLERETVTTLLARFRDVLFQALREPERPLERIEVAG
jgi:acyl transferase domain-containing protein